MAGCAIGVDLGGTRIKAGVIDRTGRMHSRVELATEASKGRDAIIANVAAAAEEARRAAKLPWSRVRAVGLGTPGGAKPGTGAIWGSPNMHCLEGKPLAAPVAVLLGLDKDGITLENDANVAAYAESWIGAGRDVGNLVLFTLGTGVGGGVVLNNEIWRGAWGAAGELGHQIIFPDGARCGCGGRGCLEAHASATAVVRRFREAVEAGERSVLAEAVKAGDTITARDIHSAARKGDRLSARIMEETGRMLGIAVANMLHILNVERVVFAGGMTGAGMLLLRPIRDEARKRTMKFSMRGVKILFSRLGNDAGLIGAAGWALRVARSPRVSGSGR